MNALFKDKPLAHLRALKETLLYMLGVIELELHEREEAKRSE